jgi:hypothetical protein
MVKNECCFVREKILNFRAKFMMTIQWLKFIFDFVFYTCDSCYQGRPKDENQGEDE